MHISMLRLLRASSALCFAVAMSMPAWASGTDTHLRDTLAQLAERAKPGTLGVTVVDLETHDRTRINADRGYPMMSVFKAPVAAAVLAEVDAGRVALDQEVTIDRKDVVGGSAVPSIGAHFAGRQMRFTVDRLLVAAVSESDNTAVDALIRLLGGPAVVTRYLRDHGIDGMRVDLSEGDVSHIFDGTANGQTIPENETEAAQAVRRQRGYQAFMADARNTTTPDAAADFLEKLSRGKLLSADSTQRLLRLMYDQTVPNRMRAGLPPDLRFADKCGTSYTLDGQTAAFNDIGIVTWPDGHTVVVAAFLTGSRADANTRNALFADIARAVAARRQGGL
ncbi:class A beta-lactamase [Luteibacter sp. SG786]|uniref:class A beta-lactamase n=1 Tax=Luteibacter sp. SG786 TaxID=2587130 RepID=UPI00141F2BDC|nr:class A beta-lactamase [Luteibacter sp. SG786]NII55125.1 beta-lactamase class A [Luteibacter sp. SG786]